MSFSLSHPSLPVTPPSLPGARRVRRVTPTNRRARAVALLSPLQPRSSNHQRRSGMTSSMVICDEKSDTLDSSEHTSAADTTPEPCCTDDVTPDPISSLKSQPSRSILVTNSTMRSGRKLRKKRVSFHESVLEPTPRPGTHASKGELSERELAQKIAQNSLTQRFFGEVCDPSPRHRASKLPPKRVTHCAPVTATPAIKLRQYGRRNTQSAQLSRRLQVSAQLSDEQKLAQLRMQSTIGHTPGLVKRKVRRIVCTSVDSHVNGIVPSALHANDTGVNRMSKEEMNKTSPKSRGRLASQSRGRQMIEQCALNCRQSQISPSKERRKLTAKLSVPMDQSLEEGRFDSESPKKNHPSLSVTPIPPLSHSNGAQNTPASVESASSMIARWRLSDDLANQAAQGSSSSLIRIHKPAMKLEIQQSVIDFTVVFNPVELSEERTFVSRGCGTFDLRDPFENERGVQCNLMPTLHHCPAQMRPNQTVRKQTNRIGRESGAIPPSPDLRTPQTRNARVKTQNTLISPSTLQDSNHEIAKRHRSDIIRQSSMNSIDNLDDVSDERKTESPPSVQLSAGL